MSKQQTLKKIFFTSFVFISLLPAWPPPGTPAPDVSLPDTAGVYHNIISENHGYVIQLFFWQST